MVVFHTFLLSCRAAHIMAQLVAEQGHLTFSGGPSPEAPCFQLPVLLHLHTSKCCWPMESSDRLTPFPFLCFMNKLMMILLGAK